MAFFALRVVPGCSAQDGSWGLDWAEVPAVTGPEVGIVHCPGEGKWQEAAAGSAQLVPARCPRPDFVGYRVRRCLQRPPVGGSAAWEGYFEAPCADAATFTGVGNHAAHAADDVEQRLGVFILLGLLLITVVASYGVERLGSNFPLLGSIFPESSCSVLIGVFAGFVIQLLAMPADTQNGADSADRKSGVSSLVRFNDDFFFMFLLPPIIFESGFNMKHEQTKAFFHNMGAILLFAMFGTILSCVVTAMLVYGCGLIGIATFGDKSLGFTWLESMVFGASLAATDPVTVLAIFGKSKDMDMNLYSLVFGESVLNDAVAIVLYGSFDKMRSVGGDAAALVFSTFAVMFGCSVLVGLLTGIVSALLLKHLRCWKSTEHFTTEQSLLLIFPFISYMLAEWLELSGIVSILLCGMTMNYYTRHNLHENTKDFNKRLFKVLAATCETFVFIYIGLGVCSFQHTYRLPLFGVSLAAISIARAANIYGLSFIINGYARKYGQAPGDGEFQLPVPRRFQHMLWFCGLRGAIAFALALRAREAYATRTDGSEGAGGAMFTTTLLITLFSVLVQGGSTDWVMSKLIPKDSEMIPTSCDDEPPSPDSDPSCLYKFDKNYLKKFLCIPKNSRREDESESRAAEYEGDVNTSVHVTDDTGNAHVHASADFTPGPSHSMFSPGKPRRN
jgi:sodium/hydrogen exchanger 3